MVKIGFISVQISESIICSRVACMVYFDWIKHHVHGLVDTKLNLENLNRSKRNDLPFKRFPFSRFNYNSSTYNELLAGNKEKTV